MILYYHPESDSLFTQRYPFDNPAGDAALCEDVTTDRRMVARYNREHPEGRLHLYKDREDGLAFCEVCRCGECELTTDCPGGPVEGETRGAVCRGDIDYFSGVWL